MKQLSKLTKNFTRIDNQILQDGSVSIEAKGVYCYLVSLPNDWQFSLKNIAKALSVGEKKLTNIFKELIALNLLKKWYYNDENGYKRLEICLYDYSTRENPTMPKGEVGLATQNRDIKNTKPYNKEQILHSQKGVLENTTQNRELQDMPNTETPLNANENPTMPKGEVGYTIYNTKKESNKEINMTKEQDFFSKEIFENLSTSDSIKEHLNNLDKKNKAIFEKEFLAYKQEFAKKLYENSNDKVGISLELWIKYILSKDKAIKNKKRHCTLKAIEKDFKSLFKLQEMGILEKRIDDALESSWQGIWFDSDAQKYNSGNFQRQYNATKGNSGESFFSDNPDDYINPNTPGVKSVNGAVYEVDMFELLGRKD